MSASADLSRLSLANGHLLRPIKTVRRRRGQRRRAEQATPEVNTTYDFRGHQLTDEEHLEWLDSLRMNHEDGERVRRALYERVTARNDQRGSGDTEQLLEEPSHTGDEVIEEPELVVANSRLRSVRQGYLDGNMILKGTYETLDASYESLDYHLPRCELREDTMREAAQRRRQRSEAAELSLLYLVIALIGVLVGASAMLIFLLIDLFSSMKYYLIRTIVDGQPLNGQGSLVGISCAVAVNSAICLFAVYVGVACPVAVGSGIPHIKAYLNGINVPKLLRFNTFVMKSAGVVASVVGGLPVGKEGPMIHAGAIVGGGFSQGKATSFAMNLPFFTKFRNDADKRDFVVAGAAAGVTAAFGTPLGGVLFALEEALSHWSGRVTMMALMCSAFSYYSLNTLKSFYLQSQSITSGGLVTFGAFTQELRYNHLELVVFGLVGVFGGLSGAAWNALNARLTQYRLRWSQSTTRRVIEMLLWSCIITAIAYGTMMVIVDCKMRDEEQSSALTMQLMCADGHIHALAELWFETPENCVKDMLHQPAEYYSVRSLFVFAVSYFVMTCVTYGMTISSGLFVPNILLGALWGRLFGIFLATQFPGYPWCDVGTYALIGAAAQLSGLVRMTFSLSVILVEATQGYNFLLPLLVTVFVSKYVSQIFNHGIYEIHMNLTGVPFLEDKMPRGTEFLQPKDIMSTPVKCLRMQMPVSEISTLLHETSHHAFPVTDSVPEGDSVDHFGRLRGIVNRHDIVTKLYNQFFEDRPNAVAETWSAYSAPYPRYFNFDEVWHHDPDILLQQTAQISLKNIASRNYFAASVHCSLDQLYADFRSNSVRHLIIVDDENNVVGMVTRKDLATLTEGHNGTISAKSWFLRGEGAYSKKESGATSSRMDSQLEDRA